MNDTEFRSIGEGVYGLVVWDEAWQSYNNCYVLLREGSIVLVDTGKAEHWPQLQEALTTLGTQVNGVSAVLATHGHRDHVGNLERFPAAERHLHPADLELLDPSWGNPISHLLPDVGEVHGLSCWRWGDHTAGSCVLHDPHSRVAFVGDLLCFFGDPLPGGSLVGRGEALRQALIEAVIRGEVWKDPRIEPERFQRGLAYLSTLEVETLASGHGAVLQGDLASWFAELAVACEASPQERS